MSFLLIIRSCCSKSYLAPFLSKGKTSRMWRERHYLYTQVAGKELSRWHRWEVQKSRRKSALTMWFGMINFHGNDFEKPWFNSLVWKGHLLLIFDHAPISSNELSCFHDLPAHSRRGPAWSHCTSISFWSLRKLCTYGVSTWRPKCECSLRYPCVLPRDT